MEKNDLNQINVDIYGYSNIHQYKTDVAFKTLVQSIQDDMYVIPPFQRVYKWSQQQVQNLAISLIRGLPIPPIYTYRNSKGQLEILDGQQRVISMLLYYMGKYTKKKTNNCIDLRDFHDMDTKLTDSLKKNGLIDVEYEMDYYEIINGNEVKKTIDITYEKLPSNIKRKLDYTNVTVIEINIDKTELSTRYLYKIFANLNSGGTILNSQELRNGIYGCEFYRMLYEINNNNETWRKFFGTETDSSKNIERLLTFSAYKYYVEYKNGEYSIRNNIELEGREVIATEYKNMDKLLNDFSEHAIKFKKENIENYKKDIEEFISLLDGEIPKTLLKENLLEYVFTVTNKTKKRIRITEEVLNKIKNSEKYTKGTKQGNRNKSAIEGRLKVVHDAISDYIR